MPSKKEMKKVNIKSKGSDKSVTILLIILLVAAIVLAAVATWIVVAGNYNVPEEEPGNVANIYLEILAPDEGEGGGTTG